MDNQEMSEVLSRLDERTKYIKENLDKHINEPACERCELKDEVARLHTNVSWIKRVGAAVAVIFATTLGIKGF